MTIFKPNYEKEKETRNKFIMFLNEIRSFYYSSQFFSDTQSAVSKQ